MRALKTLLPAVAISLGLSCSLASPTLAQDDTASEVSAGDNAIQTGGMEEDAVEVEVVDSRSIRSLRSEALGATDVAVANAAIEQLQALAATNAEAAYALAEVYLAGGKAIPLDPAKAVPLLETAAAAGEARAFKRLGDIYRATPGMEDPLKAYQNYKSAADLGDATSGYRTGDYLRAGEVIPRDVNAAIRYYEIAANGGHRPSLMRLGDVYRSGTDDGLELAKAIPWYERAADAGNAEANYRLGEIYRIGIDGMPHLDLALTNYERGAQAGNTQALMRLARGLLNETLASGRAAEGYALLQKAVSEGVSGASVYLAEAQLEGTGTTADPQAGLETLTAATNGGDISAARYLIQLYTTGRLGVRTDIVAARNVLDQIGPTAEPAIVSYENVIVATAEGGDYGPIGDNFANLDARMKQSALSRVYSMDRNAYVYLLQRRLQDLGHYSGSLNGLMTRSTISAVNQFCAANDIVTVCRLGPLSNVARRSIAEVIFE